jgi:hypothetical protein
MGELDHSCRSCGGCLVAVETRSPRRFRDRLQIDPDRRVSRYETCLDCRSVALVRTVNPRRVSGGSVIGPGYVAL